MVGGSAADPGGGDDERSLLAARTDPQGFVEFYDRRHARVTAYFYGRILCTHTAADLTAETFARLWAGRVRFDPSQGSAMGWTMGIATNLYRQWSEAGVVSYTGRRRLQMATPRLADDDIERIERLVDLETMRAGLHDAIAELSPSLREAVMLRVAADLPYAEVAERLGCSVGAARVRVSRALDALCERMGEP